MGKLTLLSSESVTWLTENYSGLTISSNLDEINGQIKLIAAYNSNSGRFLNISNGQINTIGGVVLKGDLEISISNLKIRPYSDLPALYIHNKEIQKIKSRHFNQIDGSACICGPIQEKTFLVHEFDFRIFFEKLIIPFLYGQLHYNIYRKWPWKELEHGSLGVLESYYINTDSSKIADCIKSLKIEQENWKCIESVLKQSKPVEGHNRCLCGSGKFIRNCHFEAWQGLNKLKKRYTSPKFRDYK